VPLPDLIAPDPELKEKLEEIHELHATLLFVIVSVHVAAAFLHSLRKDGALARITTTGPIIAFVATALLGSATLTRIGDEAGESLGTGARSAVTVAMTGTSDLDAWNIDYDASYIRFTATQAGAGVNGEWQEWSADLHFDEARQSKLSTTTAIRFCRTRNGSTVRIFPRFATSPTASHATSKDNTRRLVF
jgi:hypothetical protein